MNKALLFFCMPLVIPTIYGVKDIPDSTAPKSSTSALLYSKMLPQQFVHSFISRHQINFEPKILHTLISLSTEIESLDQVTGCRTIQQKIKTLLNNLAHKKDPSLRESYHVQKSFLQEVNYCVRKFSNKNRSLKGIVELSNECTDVYTQDARKEYINPKVQEAVDLFFKKFYKKLKSLENQQACDLINKVLKSTIKKLFHAHNDFLKEQYYLQKSILQTLLKTTRQSADINVHQACMHSTLNPNKISHKNLAIKYIAKETQCLTK